MIVNGHPVEAETSGRSRGDGGRGGSDSLGVHTSYESAQRLVDTLAEHRFPLWRMRIVGRDLHPFEAVVGRLAVSRAVLLGAACGAGFGLLFRLVFMYTTAFSVFPLLIAVLLGSACGAFFGAIAHTVIRRRRPRGPQRLTAHRYEVLIDTDLSELAREVVLHERGARTSPMYPSDACASRRPTIESTATCR